MSTVSFPGDSFVIQTTKYRWAEWRSSSIVVVPSIVSGAPETGWKEIRSLPAWISAVKPGVSVVIVIPPELPQETIELVQQRAVDAFVAGDCEGLARVDFFVLDGGEVILNELNTMPGFTDTSVYAKLFEASGIGYAELLDRLIELALERAERRSKLQY